MMGDLGDLGDLGSYQANRERRIVSLMTEARPTITPQAAADLAAARRRSPFYEPAPPDSRLPPPAREKRARIVADAAAAMAHRAALHSQAQALLARRRAIEDRLDWLRSQQRFPDSDPQVVVELENLDAAKAAHAEAQSRHTDFSAGMSAANHLVRRIDAYIEQIGRRVIELAAPIVPELLDGETPADAVERLRGKLTELRAELQYAIDAPVPSAQAKKIATAMVDELARKGAPDVSATVDSGRPPLLPGRRFGDHVRPHDRYFGEVDQVDGVALVVWLMRDQFIKALSKAIDAEASDDEALTDEQRAQIIAETKAAILAVERSEEEIISAAEAAGMRIERRADVDPRALLGIGGPEPKDGR